MIVRLIKVVTLMTIGMMLAPKKGVELRADFVKMVKKNNAKLKQLINKMEIVWEKSSGVESDEVTANLEVRINDIKSAVDILDSTTTKEMAYKALKKIDKSAVSIIKSTAKSPNVRAVARELAKVSVSSIDAAIKLHDDIKKTSINAADKLIIENKKPKTLTKSEDKK